MATRDGGRRRRTAAVAVAVLLAAACTGDGSAQDDAGLDGQGADAPGTSATPQPDPDDYCAGAGGGELVWVHEQAPPDLHVDGPANGLSITAWIQQGMLEGLYTVTTTTSFAPELLAEEIEVVDNGDDTVTLRHTLREGLRWSDGQPLTARDVQHTYELIVDDDQPIGPQQGYELIDPDSWSIDSDTEFSYTTTPFSGYRGLFPRILPAHVLVDAATANEALRSWRTAEGAPVPASGPLEFGSWEPGRRLTLTRNDDYHGAHPEHPEVTNRKIACVSGVRIDFVPDSTTQIRALRSGEADLIFAPPQPVFAEHLLVDDAVTTVAGPGATFEHWSLNLFDEHLAHADVREALAYAMDKAAVVEALYAPLFGDALPAAGLGNTYWMPHQSAYVDHAGEAGYGRGDVGAAQELLESAGYTLNGDGFFEHPERGQLTLRVGTTGGNELRERQLQILQEQLIEAGFDIRVDNVPGGAYFSERPFHPDAIECSMTQGSAGDCTIFDIAQFASAGGAWPGDQNVAYLAGSAANPHGYASDAFDAKAAECSETVEADAVGDCFNELDRLVTTRDGEDGLVILPLTQRPNVYAYATERFERAAVAVDAHEAGPIVNVVDFRPAA